MSNEGLPNGYYKVRAIEGSDQYPRTKNGGVQLALELEVVEGDFAGERVLTFLSFSGNARQYTTERILALGWNYEYTADEKHVGIGSNVVTMESRIDTWQKPDGTTEDKRRYEIKTPRKNAVFEDQVSGAELRTLLKEQQVFAKQMGSGSPRPSSSPNAKTGYDANWENKAAGNGGPAPKVKVDFG